MEETNHGVILKPDAPFLYMAGGETGISVVRLITDQTPYLPDTETQKSTVIDFLDCVTESFIHDIESGVNYLIQTKQFPQATLDYFTSAGYMQNGKFKCSVRFNAKMNGTTTVGNDAGTVGDHICAKAYMDGLLPDSEWSMTPNMTWDEYYSEIPQELKNKAKVIYQYITVRYQKCPVNAQTLALAPVQIFTAICKGWSTDTPVNTCNQPCQHATLVYGLDANGDYLIRDQYVPFNKVLAKDYYLYYSQQAVVTIPTSYTTVVNTSHKFGEGTVLKKGSTGADVTAWQKILSIEGFLDPIYIIGVFGPRTELATEQLQEKYKDFILVPAGLSSPTGIAGQWTLSWANQKYS